MTITYHPAMIQGSDEWIAARCGMLTAGSIKLILAPTLKIAANDKVRAHVYELAAQRITRYVEPSYIGDDMLRGMEDEILARELYAEQYAPVTECGLITNDEWGFTIGYSPDGLVGDDGLIEVKSRRQRFQVETVLMARVGVIPTDFVLQCQTGLLVSRRSWLDFISYSGGMPMVTVRVWPDDAVQAAILGAAEKAEDSIRETVETYRDALASGLRTIPTERRIVEEMIV